MTHGTLSSYVQGCGRCRMCPRRLKARHGRVSEFCHHCAAQRRAANKRMTSRIRRERLRDLREDVEAIDRVFDAALRVVKAQRWTGDVVWRSTAAMTAEAA